MIEIPKEIKDKKFTISGAMLIFIILLAVGCYMVYDDYSDTKQLVMILESNKAEKQETVRIYELLQSGNMADKEIRYNLRKVLGALGLQYTEIGTPEIITDTLKEGIK